MQLLLILDIDGTLANNEHRAHLVECEKPDWEAFLEPSIVMKDTPIDGSQRCVKHFQELGAEIIFLTGRREPLRETTTKWLYEYFKIKANESNLIMRPNGNKELPTVYKGNFLKQLSYPDYTKMAVEDDLYMQKVYFENGIIPLQAPECWNTLFSMGHTLPQEGYWRR